MSRDGRTWRGRHNDPSESQSLPTACAIPKPRHHQGKASHAPPTPPAPLASMPPSISTTQSVPAPPPTQSVPPPPAVGSAASEEFLSDRTFDQPFLSAWTKEAIARHFGFAKMSAVQAMSIPLALEGHRLLVRSKTGSGKTLAFLIPIVESLLKGPKTQGTAFHALILSPTRELAMQTMSAAGPLCGTRGQAVCLVGGNNRNTDVRHLSQRVDIVIATPGRLLDHLENTAGVSSRMQGLREIVLDEADRMLDMGFLPDVSRILQFAPPPTATHGALFSATIPRGIVDVAGLVLGESFLSVDVTAGGKVTHIDSANRLLPDDPMAFVRSVSQSIVPVTIATIAPSLVVVLDAEMKKTPFKIMVFCVAARVTQYYAELLQAMGVPVLEMHSRKSQSHRQRTSEAFRTGTNIVMLSSDVTARGMDYPDVTAVIQVGMASDGEQYTHRIGRTARAGKSGIGIALWLEEEMALKRQLTSVTLTTRLLPSSEMEYAKNRVMRVLQNVPAATGARAYCAWMGYYNSHLRFMKWDKPYLVSMSNLLASEMGFCTPPPLEAKTIGKMGLRGIPGIVVAAKGRFTWGE